MRSIEGEYNTLCSRHKLYTLETAGCGITELIITEFTGNKIRDEGGVALCELLKVNTSLKSLRAGGEYTETEPHTFFVCLLD